MMSSVLHTALLEDLVVVVLSACLRIAIVVCAYSFSLVEGMCQALTVVNT